MFLEITANTFYPLVNVICYLQCYWYLPSICSPHTAVSFQFIFGLCFNV